MLREKVVFAVLTDGRPGRLSQNINSWIRNVGMLELGPVLIFDNSGSHPRNSSEVDFVLNHLIPRKFPGFNSASFDVIKIADTTLPIPDAHDYVFKFLYNKMYPNFSFAFFIEDDHFINHKIDINDLVTVLEARQDLAQLTLDRNPCYPDELKHGSPMKAFKNNGPDDIQEKTVNDIRFTERPYQFVFGVSLINLKYLNAKMPEEKECCESYFAENIIKDYPGTKFAWYGHLNDPPLATTWLHD